MPRWAMCVVFGRSSMWAEICGAPCRRGCVAPAPRRGHGLRACRVSVGRKPYTGYIPPVRCRVVYGDGFVPGVVVERPHGGAYDHERLHAREWTLHTESSGAERR